MNRHMARRIQRGLGRGLIFLILVAGAFVFLFPFLWMLSTSLKTPQEIVATQTVWIPAHPQWKNYAEALGYFPFVRYLMNTLFLVSMNVVGTLFGWLNTYLPLIVPAFTGGATNIFMLRQFFRTIPVSLSECARLDGCSEFRIFWQIVLPLCMPALATVAIFSFMFTWNDFMGPLLYINDKMAYTLSYGLRTFQLQSDSKWHLTMAASVVVAIPSLVLFFCCQKYFIEGIALTGLKE